MTPSAQRYGSQETSALPEGFVVKGIQHSLYFVDFDFIQGVQDREAPVLSPSWMDSKGILGDYDGYRCRIRRHLDVHH